MAGKSGEPWLILALSLTYYGTSSAALLSPQHYLDIWKTRPLDKDSFIILLCRSSSKGLQSCTT